MKKLTKIRIAEMLCLFIAIFLIALFYSTPTLASRLIGLLGFGIVGFCWNLPPFITAKFDDDVVEQPVKKQFQETSEQVQ